MQCSLYASSRFGKIYKQQSSFGAKICSDICPRTLSVPRNKQFSASVMEAIVFIILQIVFSNTHGFENWGILPGYSPVLVGEYSVM